MNLVVLQGRMTRDPEVRYSQANGSNMAVCRFSLAIDRYNKNGNTVDYPNCVAFGKTAENINKFFSKGSLILVKGSLKTGSYEKDGRKAYSTDVFVEGFDFCGKTNQSSVQNDSETKNASRPVEHQQASLPAGFTPVDPGQFTEDLPF